MNLIEKIKKQQSFLEKKAEQALSLLKNCKITAEVSVIKITGINVSTRYGKLENVEFNNNEKFTVTVFYKQCKGSAFSNDLNEKTIKHTVDTAVDIARYTSQDIYSDLADKELLAFESVDLDLLHPINFDTQLGLNLASQAEEVALKYDERIVCTEGSKFNSYYTTKVFGNSHGMLKSYNSSQHSLSCSVVAKYNNVMEQNYSYTLSRVFNDLLSPEWIGQECARRALERLNAKKLKTMECPVIFIAEVATSLFSHLAYAIHGNNVYRKSTFLLHDLRKKIFPDWFCITEYPHILKALGSAPFDSEGVRTSEREIVISGILNSWLLDNYSSRKIGLKSTGHADGIYNWHINHSNLSFKELIKHMYRGLIVTEIMGQGVNIMTGDYSRGVSGFWVDHGRIQYPVHEITVSGNLRDMFSKINAISYDFETRSYIRCGSVLISSMQIAGI